MTHEQIDLVQQSFKLLAGDMQSVAMLFYDRLFQLNPALRSMFRNSREEQALKLGHVLTIVVNSLHRLEQILPAVEELGRRHMNCGVTAEHYAVVGEALLSTLQSGLGNAFTAPVREAWTSAYGLLASTMQRAAAEADTVDVFSAA